MRGSVMLHLPALVMTKQISKVLAAIAKLSFASRGFYGEGTQARGNFYQISNQVSLGHSEEDIIQNINGYKREFNHRKASDTSLLELSSSIPQRPRDGKSVGRCRKNNRVIEEKFPPAHPP